VENLCPACIRECKDAVRLDKGNSTDEETRPALVCRNYAACTGRYRHFNVARQCSAEADWQLGDVLFLNPVQEHAQKELERQPEHVHVDNVQCPATRLCHTGVEVQLTEAFLDSDPVAVQELVTKFRLATLAPSTSPSDRVEPDDRDWNAVAAHGQLNAIGATVDPDQRWL
jgi:hypothetical protein